MIRKFKLFLKKLLKSPNGEVYDNLKEKFEKIAEEQAEINEIIVKNRSRILVITYFNIFVYALGFFLQIGTLPYLTKRLGADTTTFGHLQTVFAIAQLIGGPVYGRIGDMAGEKSALLVSLFAGGLSYLIMGMANSITLLFLSRIPSMLMHTMQGSQMIITFLSNEKNRATLLSRSGFSFGMGMAIGPPLGGYVVKYLGDQNCALLAGIGSFISLGLVYFFVPDIPKVHKKKENIFNFKKIIKPLLVSKSCLLLVIKLLCGLPLGIFQSMFSMIAIDKFGLEAEKTGLLLSYVGVITLFMQGFGIQGIGNVLSEKFLMKFTPVTLVFCFYIFTGINEIFDFILLLLPLTISLCLLNSILTTSITKTVSKNETGTALGMNMAIHSTIRTIAPTLGGYLIKYYGMASLGYTGVGLYLVSLLLIPSAGFKENVL
ncbi:solute carrier family 22 member 18 [Lepeophtheirus salmonis]|uniref:solute carrier family 22 member 18 n=1 Tax=Lepeophtheirus salmonis TaxID=72036 RepID=UPI001AEA00BB|nr:solute carrier family 22 member 18-like [Lepeophtheirus salmonis]XP_040568659.1 solute carrier family 22 member 18-like [Lepeophtheirus salmonis]